MREAAGKAQLDFSRLRSFVWLPLPFRFRSGFSSDKLQPQIPIPNGIKS
jgi:hypothetical protein